MCSSSSEAARPCCAVQALRLRRIAVYFDTDAEFWSPATHWPQLAPHEWDDWFLPGIGWVPAARGKHPLPVRGVLTTRRC